VSSKISNKKMGIIFGCLIAGVIIIKLAVGSKEPTSSPVVTSPTEAATTAIATLPPPNEPKPQEYAVRVKLQLQENFKSVDTHLADEGSLKWLFVTISLSEWHGLNKENRHQLVDLLIRQMKQVFPNKGLKVSIGINVEQPLAEGDWTQLSSDPDIKLVGE